MQNDNQLSGMNLRLKLIFSHAAVAAVAALAAEAMVLGVPFLITRPSVLTQSVGVHVTTRVASAGLAGLLLGAWASRWIVRRVQRTVEISRAWLRGNLSLRVVDSVADDLGLLAEQLNLLVEHLERDEQDLDELRERNARLTDQVRALAVVEERNRLARELHDSVKQHLFSLAMTASAIRARFDALPGVPDDTAPGLADMVREIETAAQAAQRETTRLIEDLRPGSLQEQGLAAALNDYTLLFGAQEHLLIYLEVQGDDGLLPPSVAEPLYRVAQEALHNVARHARATRADVSLRCMPAQATLTIHDNGIGFDTSQPRRGLGLANMQERMLTVGGRLAVGSQPGNGTTVLAEVALPHPLGTSFDPQVQAAGADVNRPSVTMENWAWLGQRLVIPVGQTWPWLPADQVHLRRPLMEPTEEPVVVEKDVGFLGLKRDYVLRSGPHRRPLVRVHCGKSGCEWEADGASWALRHVRGLSGRMVLMRNGQPLAAMQYRGRLLNTWSEIIYDGRGYRLSQVKDVPGTRVLVGEAGDESLFVTGGESPQIALRRALPLPLLLLVATRILDEDEAIPTTPRAEPVEVVSSHQIVEKEQEL